MHIHASIISKILLQVIPSDSHKYWDSQKGRGMERLRMTELEKGDGDREVGEERERRRHGKRGGGGIR
jgi:hypothetical protein